MVKRITAKHLERARKVMPNDVAAYLLAKERLKQERRNLGSVSLYTLNIYKQSRRAILHYLNNEVQLSFPFMEIKRSWEKSATEHQNVLTIYKEK